MNYFVLVSLTVSAGKISHFNVDQNSASTLYNSIKDNLLEIISQKELDAVQNILMQTVEVKK